MFGYRLHPTAATLVAALPLLAALVFTYIVGGFQTAPPAPSAPCSSQTGYYAASAASAASDAHYVP